MSITFKDNTDEVLSALEKAKKNGLEAIGMTAEAHDQSLEEFGLDVDLEKTFL